MHNRGNIIFPIFEENVIFLFGPIFYWYQFSYDYGGLKIASLLQFGIIKAQYIAFL